MTFKEKVDRAITEIPIPRYFYEIIVPAMPGYYSDYPCDFTVKPVVKCPLHYEDTPSFRYYDYSNTFFCFGCGKTNGGGGNIINLHRKFMETQYNKTVGFKEAVEFLYNYFIEGKVTQKIVYSPVRLKEAEPKQVVMRCNSYRYDIKKLVTNDRSLTLVQKEQMWELLDTCDMLLELEKISYAEVEQKIKEEIAKLYSNSKES